LFKGSDLPTKKGKIFTRARELFCPEALSVTKNDSYGYQSELNPG